MESLKATLFDKAVDILLDSITGKTQDEINEIINKNRNRKILYKIILELLTSDAFSIEYCEVVFNDDSGKWMIQHISEESINPTLSLVKLEEVIERILNHYLVSDNAPNLNNLKKLIANNYRQQCKNRITLFDIIIEIEDIQNIINQSNNTLVQLIQMIQGEKLIKINTMKNEINTGLKNCLIPICSTYINFILKKPTTISAGSQGPTLDNYISQIEDIVNNMSLYVDESFTSRDVEIIANSEQILYEFMKTGKYSTQSIDYYTFVDKIFKYNILKGISDVQEKYLDQLVPEFKLELIKLKELMDTGYFSGVEWARKYGISIQGAHVDTEKLRGALLNMGKILVHIGRFEIWI